VRAESRPARAPSLVWPPGFARSQGDRDAALVLTALRGITPRRMLESAMIHRTARALLQRIRDGDAGSPGDQAVARVLDAAVIRASLPVDSRVVLAGDDEYPPQLEHLSDPPLALFVRGRPVGAVTSMVAIVGARNCSDLGRDLARELARSLAAHGAVVVSGAARGIDAAAHEGALDAGGITLAVLGCGIDAVYPPGSGPLVGRILERGSVVSEYPPGVPPDGFRFPARNRIVAALCRAVVVVEGAGRSGSLISAEHALELGRDVFAVPGAVTNPLAEAPHRLIREGAALIRGAEDMLADLGIEAGAQVSFDDLELPGPERAAFRALRGSVVPDRVAAELGIPVPEALSLLLRLELRGLVRSVGGRFERRLAGAGPSRTGGAGIGRNPSPPAAGGPPVEA
jgi:DNA processing protein